MMSVLTKTLLPFRNMQTTRTVAAMGLIALEIIGIKISSRKMKVYLNASVKSNLLLNRSKIQELILLGMQKLVKKKT